ncbi:MAG: cytochrome c [Cyanobacteria bacterium]|nr:cytochrome c [Cyanobacteriota bacterium]MDW8202241.1 cytochrome c [Cyanobacteriota bacterium SKYGB_h_bin112]
MVQSVSVAILMVALIVLCVIFGIRYWQASDPYVSSVLLLQGDPQRGHAIFQLNCAGCHGMQADGMVGPSLLGVRARKSKVGLIHQVISGKTPPMPQFQPDSQDMADLLSYLESL